MRDMRRTGSCKKVILGNSTSAKVCGVGTVDLAVSVGGRESRITLEDVLFVPKLRVNLISVSFLMKDNTDLLFDSKKQLCKLMKDGAKIGQAHKVRNLWTLTTPGDEKEKKTESEEAPEANAASGGQGVDLWHLRFNHLNQDDLQKMERNQSVRGLDIVGGRPVKGNCVGCALGKQHREKLVAVSERRVTKPLELIHSDLVGPMEVESFQTHRKYILTFIDDSTRRSWIYLLKTKDEVFSWFKLWKAQVELQSGSKVKTLRSDGGGEYVGQDMRNWLAEQGIVQEFSNAYTPQQNGVAERFNRTLEEGMRSMLYGSGLSKGFWGEAALCFNHTRNRTPTSALKGGITPMEAWTGVKPKVYHLKAFGCKVSVHIPDSRRKKLDAKSYPGVFLGYSLERKGFRVYDSRKIEVADSRDVIFYEQPLVDRNLEYSSMQFRSDPAGAEKDTRAEPEVGAKTPNQAETQEGGNLSEQEADLPVPSDRPTEGPHRSSQVQESGFRATGGKSKGAPKTKSGGSKGSGTTDQNPKPLQAPTTAQEKEEPTRATPAPQTVENEAEQEEEIEMEEDRNSVHSDPGTEMEAESESEAEMPKGREAEEGSEEEEAEDPNSFQPRRSSRARRQPVRLAYEKLGIPTREAEQEEDAEANHACCFHAVTTEPMSWQQAMEGKDSNLWKEAAESELESLKKNGTYNVVELPKGKKALKNKWVFKVKTRVDGSLKYKARLVIKGFLQKEGVDYSETFAPVVKYKSLRLLLGIANQRNMEVHQMDVTTAFLHGDLEEEIYMVPPEGMEVKGKVWKLERSLYGLKQAPRCWNKKIDQFLVAEGFYRNTTDYATYSKGKREKQVILALYVDDLLIMSETLQEVLKVKVALSRRFEMVDFGEVNTVLGMRVTRDRERGLLQIDQEKYAEEVLKRFNMEDCKPISIPLSPGDKLSQEQGAFTEAERRAMEVIPYRQVIGSLMYLMVCTRPDLASAIGLLSRFMQDPGRAHWEAAKRVLRYIQHTKHLGLHYGRKQDLELVGFCDSDWGGDQDKRKSTTGYVFLVGGGAFSWCSKRQGAVALSSCEAEYYASSQAAAEVAWQRQFLEEIGMKLEEPITVGSDSQSALNLIGNPVYHEKTKHIGIRFHYVREQVQKKEVEFVYVPTEFQVADALTKAVPRLKLEYCRKRMGVQQVSYPQQVPSKSFGTRVEKEDLC